MRNFNKLSKSTACLGLALCLALPAQAGYEKTALRYNITQPRKMGLQYDVYAGGFKAMNAELVMDLDKKAYDMELHAQTQGFIGKLFPWKAGYATQGQAIDGELVPSLYTSSSSWKNDTKVTEMSYGPHGNLLKTTVQEKGRTTVNRDIRPELAQDAVDMLTGALMIFQNVKNTDSCKGTFPVFDGKRRFNITLKDGGKETLPQSRYSAFSGEAVRCTLKVEPVAGFKEKDKKRGWLAVQEHTEQRNKPPTLWLARIEEGGPVVPVRMEIRSDYGAVVAHLSDRK